MSLGFMMVSLCICNAIMVFDDDDIMVFDDDDIMVFDDDDIMVFDDDDITVIWAWWMTMSCFRNHLPSLACC